MKEQTRLNLGKEWRYEHNGYTATVSHIDRSDDPYLSFVVSPEGKIIGSGLHPTFPDAKDYCKKKVVAG